MVRAALLALVVSVSACAVDDGDPTGIDTAYLNGDTWTTVGNNDGVGYGANYGGVALAQFGQPWVVGARNEASGIQTWIVLDGSGPGSALTPMDAWHLAANKTSAAQKVAVDLATNTLYVAGVAFDATDHAHLIVRALSVGTNTWTIDYNEQSTNGGGNVLGLAVATNGEVYVAAELNGTRILRKRATNGTWSNLAMPTGLFKLGGICTNGTALVAVGSVTLVGTSWSAWSWGGLAWANIDTYSPDGTPFATACVADGSSLYVAGTLTNPAGDLSWTTRSRIGTGSFTTVDSVASPHTGAPVSMTVGRLGRIYEAGQHGVDFGSTNWLVRRSGSPWLPSDVVDSPVGVSLATGVAYDSAHDYAYAVGTSFVSSDESHALYRVSH